MGKSLYYKITWIALYCLSVLAAAVGAVTTNEIGVLLVFARPNKVQLSIGAVKVILVPGGSLRRFGLSAGRSTNAVQDLFGDTTIIAPVTWPEGCTVRGVWLPSIYWCMLPIPITDAATRSTIIDTEVFPNMVLRLSYSIKQYNDCKRLSLMKRK